MAANLGRLPAEILLIILELLKNDVVKIPYEPHPWQTTLAKLNRTCKRHRFMTTQQLYNYPRYKDKVQLCFLLRTFIAQPDLGKLVQRLAFSQDYRGSDWYRLGKDYCYMSPRAIANFYTKWIDPTRKHPLAKKCPKEKCGGNCQQECNETAGLFSSHWPVFQDMHLLIPLCPNLEKVHLCLVIQYTDLFCSLPLMPSTKKIRLRFDRCSNWLDKYSNRYSNMPGLADHLLTACQNLEQLEIEGFGWARVDYSVFRNLTKLRLTETSKSMRHFKHILKSTTKLQVFEYEHHMPNIDFNISHACQAVANHCPQLERFCLDIQECEYGYRKHWLADPEIRGSDCDSEETPWEETDLLKLEERMAAFGIAVRFGPLEKTSEETLQTSASFCADSRFPRESSGVFGRYWGHTPQIMRAHMPAAMARAISP